MEEQLGTQNLKHAQTHRPIHHSVRHEQRWIVTLLPQMYQLLHLVYQAYRNISRTVKQYLYGDKNAE